MVNTTRKLFLKIFDAEIRDFLEINKCLTPNQYGFRRSTLDTATRLKKILDVCRGKARKLVDLFTLGVENACNLAPWTAGIIEEVPAKDYQSKRANC